MTWIASLILTLTLVQPGTARTLVIGITQYPSNFHPNIDSMAAKGYVLAMTQRPFTTYDADWNLICMLCTELPTLENGKAVIEKQDDGTDGIALTYTIVEDATWGDGTPVTTDDVLFTQEVGLHPESGVVSAEGYRRITSIDVIDDKTFTLHVDRVTFNYNAINDFRLLPAHLERAVFEEDPATYRNRTLFDTATATEGLYFGPYKITEAASGAHVVLGPNPTWWGAAPHFQKIVIKAIENTAALEANLLAGDIDMIAGEPAGITIDQALAFEQRHGDDYQIVYKPGLIYEHLDVNLDNPILADVRVRRALIQGIDRAAINQQLFEGRQPVAHSGVNPLDWVFFDGVTKYQENLDAAAALLDEAGWTEMRDGVRHSKAGEPLALELMTTAGNRTRELVQQVLQSQWKRLGIEVTIKNEPARVFFGETVNKRKFTGLAMFAWISSPENVPRTTLHSEEIPSDENGWSGQNYTGYANPELDQLLDDLERELDREKRLPMWQEVQEIYATDLPAIPLYFRADSHVWPKWLKGVVPTGHQYSSALWVENWYAEDESN
ncbi:MAG: peptide ABC transporter substrate-binding protein [Alphaproteobacteria bacterium]|nr:peptide ABC transporter substrate-binding protein [Alphaproteobacteria bacterium]